MVTFKRAGGGSVAENLFNMNKALVLNSNTAKRKKKELTFTLSALYHMSKLESPRRLSSSPQGDKGPPHSLAPPLHQPQTHFLLGRWGHIGFHLYFLPVRKLEKSPKMSNGKSVTLTSPSQTVPSSAVAERPPRNMPLVDQSRSNSCYPSLRLYCYPRPGKIQWLPPELWPKPGKERHSITSNPSPSEIPFEKHSRKYAQLC